jgi:cytochrome c oxidase subunit 3
MMKTKLRPFRRGTAGDDSDFSDRFWHGWRGGGDEYQHYMSWVRFGVWVFIGVIGIMFASLMLVYIARLSQKPVAQFEPPKLLWISTTLLLLSSVTCQWALHSIRRGNLQGLRYGLTITLALGINFLLMQLLSWKQLHDLGITAQQHLFSGLFYLFTGLHGIHLLGGMLFMMFVWYQAMQNVYTPKRHLGVEMGTLYWHSMDVLWLALFGLIMFT